MVERMNRKPNILFLMSDEHRATVTGFAGDPVVRTPNLDHLATTGVVFEHAYSPSPICIPGRQCLMSGQFPRTNGCEIFGQDLPPGHMTFSRRLSQYGYATVACGKLHHYGTDQMQGWTRRIGDDAEIHAKYIADKDEEQFRLAKGPHLDHKWSQEKEIKRAGIGSGPHVVKDEYTIKGALNFIDNYFVNPVYDREMPNRPLLLKVSLLQPHYPYTADEKRFRYYLNRVEPYKDQLLFDHPFLSRFHIRPGVHASEREIRRAVAAYYALVETMDEHMGTVMNALEQAGQNLDEWIVIYTSDHGEMLGEHEVWEKQKFFEGSVRVPLMIRWPSKYGGGRTVTENVSLCDLFATICEMTGIEAPPSLDSRSLVPLLQGDNTSWDNEAISQFGGTNLMIKRDSLKYQYYTNMPELLFDLDRNPAETNNYIDDPDYAEQVARFRERSKELGFA